MKSVRDGESRLIKNKGAREGHVWAVVLAAGEGKRLAGLTTAIYGYPLPKQFAVLDGRRSLLQHTLDRIAGFVPFERTLVIVSEGHLALAKKQLAAFPGVEILTQPRNLDTAPGVLLPLTHIRKRDPMARIVYLPSDHHVARPEVFVKSLREALRAVSIRPETVAMLGVEAERPETEYGWIRPGASANDNDSPRPIVEFIEKPDPASAVLLKQSGCLWNTFVFAARASTLWKLFEKTLPEHARAFERFAPSIGTHDEPAALEQLYQITTAANCSKSVFEPARNLVVIKVEGSGWSDWGSPKRVFESLAGTAAGAALARNASEPVATVSLV